MINRRIQDSIRIDGLKIKIEEQNLLINQLKEINVKQLETSNKIQLDNLYSDKPKIIVTTNILNDANNFNESVFSPLIITNFKNNGKRYAMNISNRNFMFIMIFRDIEKVLILKLMKC